MSTRPTIILTATLILAATLVGALLYPRLPEQMASHWDINSQVNGHMPRFWGVFLLPLVSVALLGSFLVIPRIDPLRDNIAKFRGYFNTFITLLVIFLIYLYGLTLIWNLGYTSFNMG